MGEIDRQADRARDPALRVAQRVSERHDPSARDRPEERPVPSVNCPDRISLSIQTSRGTLGVSGGTAAALHTTRRERSTVRTFAKYGWLSM